MTGTENRRPLASRQTGWAASVTRWLTGTSVTPNQISQAGMVAALLAGAAFWGAGSAGGATRVALLVAAGLFVQLRLLCNLFDGMVAVEAGRGAPDGGFWNEFPDRVSDLLILMGAALAVGDPALGWAAAGMAFLTAYLRELGVNCGAGADFSGPMAKQHRMAVMTGAAGLSLFEPLLGWHGQVLNAALWIVALGAGLTVLRRAWRLVARLRAG
ncbi:CDP-alcohol phosphatidyltransferase family protein [Paracoccus siganidrum]|uniref:CDP-alcohol phosphatidyltransferase family protein n=1 Tax=Paracoccus siganidrum TaxID=1276757 RepID=A0A418ZWB1_9RHOB|nr:CDP-alcohol phosphatidyltransferase family protein [Paracoccus siganidrum]RJL04781.1 CDP-alcohol phosphatidyltransferase family protein [Paracoccus siganidrum]RMC34629.1 CDP-alcohol phosphatidyltransferase family protein [Paracoccus siganidrum]